MHQLFPHLAGVAIEAVEDVAGVVCVRASARAVAGVCVRCGCEATRVHSRYERCLADAPVGGRRLAVRLRVRRWFCDEEACGVVTFVEQIAGLTVRHGRRTPLLRAMLEGIAVALAGRAGARLAAGLHASASRSTLLRLLEALPDPAANTPRVLGVDDFALRRGQNYGTVLIDCETGAPLELLAGRDAATLANWLAAHPGVQVICRDRSGSYAEGARVGAPDAIQVADRFHLWQNIGKAVERCVARHRDCLRATEATPVDRPIPRPRDEEPVGRFAQRAARHHAQVHDLLASGHSIRGIARGLGWGQRTVQRYARAANWQELVDGKWKNPRPSKLDPFKPYLRQRWEAGSRNALDLHREITAHGFHGSYTVVRRYLEQHRDNPAPIAAMPPTVRQVTGWLTRHPDTLSEDDRSRLQAALEHCPHLRAAAEHVRAFGEIVTTLQGQRLPDWIAAVRADGLPGLTSFANGLESDFDAVVASLTMPWNSGPVEGRVNHIKMIKRQMFGRAGLPLLRKRVLLTAAQR
ncbi:ISL3 family transposase [Nocardia takedensis]|uniref:ISL3 family transposase n=1 Tax=Nocardia takedensis TaxID=259390 RepID=UPI003F75AB3B